MNYPLRQTEERVEDPPSGGLIAHINCLVFFYFMFCFSDFFSHCMTMDAPRGITTTSLWLAGAGTRGF